ncbi:MAG: HAMP domain-containing protein [Planctomycetes bacterium]|nr:HAMP domain-containing protein [Planctomycetota bacterium]
MPQADQGLATAAVRLPALRRLNMRIVRRLVFAFVLIVLLFLASLLPFQRGQLRRFIDDRRTFLDVLVEARRGDISHWWVQDSVDAHWYQFERTILGNPGVLRATLYYRPGPGERAVRDDHERLVVTSDPVLVEDTFRAARAAGVQLESWAAAAGDPGAPLLAAADGAIWIRSSSGQGWRGKLGGFTLPDPPPDVRSVGVESAHAIHSRAGQRVLWYCALIYIGAPRRPAFEEVGHLVVENSLADVDAQEAAIRSLFYVLFGALFLVLLGVLNFSLARDVVRPIREVLAAMRRAGAGDLDVRLEKHRADEIGLMAEQFNQMVQDLRRSKVAIEDYSRTLEQRVADRTRELMRSEERARGLKDHLMAVLEHVQAGVLAVDAAGRIVTFNERSGYLLGLDPAGVLGRPAAEVLSGPGLEPLHRLVFARTDLSPISRAEVKLGPPGKVRVCQAAVTTLEGGAKVVVLDDVTELIYSKRLVAWREAVERVIHDIKNPLTPVRLSAQQMRVAYEDRSPDLLDIVDRATQNILTSVDSLERMLADFSLLYRRPRAEPRPVELNDMVRRILQEQAPAVGEGVVVEARLADDLPTILGDPLGLWRLVTNLVQNGLEAMQGRRGSFTVTTAAVAGSVRLMIFDQGPGIPPDRMDKLFEPYLTTKPKGTGLGLVIARQIAEDHGGSIRVRSEVGVGTVVEVDLPPGAAAR